MCAAINRTCISCNSSVNGKYCSNCGEPITVKKITLKGLLHDVFHFFTHIEKGLFYTLKELLVNPGTMQRSYIAGSRSRHQKPFSAFFLCLTVLALIRYWVASGLIYFYGNDDTIESAFFHKYMLILLLSLLPINILVAWLVFKKSKYNFAEVGVLMLYTMSGFFMYVALISLLRYIWPHLDTAYIEAPVLLVYNIFTFIRFFNFEKKWIVILKTIVLFFIVFELTQVAENLVKAYMFK